MKTKTQIQFEKEVKEVTSISLKGIKLFLMQQYIIWRMGFEDFFFNTSGTGTGKTIAALAVSSYYNLRMLVITNNSGKKSYKVDADEIGYDKNKMLVINYEKFSRENCSEKYIKMIKDFDPQFVVFDEVQNIKVNETAGVSTRSVVLNNLIKELNYKKLLIQTATPVLNNVSETESLIRIGRPGYDTTGLTKHSRRVLAYTELVDMSICFPKEMMEGGDVFTPITYTKKYREEKFISKVKYDNYNFDVKFEAMLSYIRPGTIIYTQYTDGVVDKLYKELSKSFSVGKYTGVEKDTDFCNYEVMIITSAGSTGTNGLQKCFDRMIFFSLPHTWGHFEQSTGRIDRINGTNFSKVEFFFLIDDGEKSSHCDQKAWYRISKKRIISEQIRDGRINKSVQNKSKLKKVAKKQAV